MGSYNDGKDWVCRWIREHFGRDSQILDVGACDGKWRYLLKDYPRMDAVEVWEPNCRQIAGLYRKIYHADIRTFSYPREYDLIIFGDVLEHMSTEDAQAVLREAWNRCTELIVCVPFLYQQGAIYGNPYEVHIQDDLTREIMTVRYPELDVLHDPGGRICYYHKKLGDGE